MIEYNPLKTEYKSVTGGVSENAKFRIFVLSTLPVTMRIYTDNRLIERLMKKKADGFYLDLKLKRGLYFYDFISDGRIYGKGDDFNLCENGSSYQLTVYPEDYKTPDWIKGGIIYQIFPDRFCRVGDFSVGKGKIKREDWGGMPNLKSPDGVIRNNEFFGGNFKGITSKLDYLKEFCVNAVYLNPICKSYSSHRYDTGDYKMPDEVLGSLSDFKELTKKGGEKGIYFIFDGVFNHTGAGSKYFNKYGDYSEKGAYNDKDSQYYDWYTFTDYPKEYRSWWGFKTLPEIRRNCESFQDFIVGDGGVIDFWENAGIRGIRLDVADELSDDFIAKIRNKVKENSDNILIGEVWEDATNKVAYGERKRYFSEGELDSVMNYPLRSGIIDFILKGDCSYLKSVIEDQINNYPKVALDCLMNILSTHDSTRIITLLGRRETITDKELMADEILDEFEYNRGKVREKCASVLQFFLYGVPSIYYGDEEGLEGDLDPYNRRCYDWKNGDEELIAHYKKLAEIRSKNEVFVSGKTEILYAHKGLFVFSRGYGKDKITVAVNCGNNVRICSFADMMIDLYTGKTEKNFEIKNYGFAVLKSF